MRSNTTAREQTYPSMASAASSSLCVRRRCRGKSRRHGEKAAKRSLARIRRRAVRLLDFVDQLGNSGWARNPQTDATMSRCVGPRLTVEQVKTAMRSIDYDDHPCRC